MKKEQIIKIIIVIIIVLSITVIFIYKHNNRPENNSITNKETNEDINVNKLPMLIDFGSTTCEPCKTMFPILESIENKYKDKLIVKFINVNSEPINTKKYSIKAIPTQIFFDSDGKIIYRHEGVLYEDKIIEKLNEMGIK